MKNTASRLAFTLLVTLIQVGCAGGPGAGQTSWWQRLKSPLTRSPASADSPIGGKGQADDPLAHGRMLERFKEWDKAHAYYSELRTKSPQDATVLHRLGVVCDQMKRHDEARECYTRAIALNPRDGELFNDLGYCLFLQGKLEEAESALRKATALTPDASRFHNNLGMVLGHQRKHDEALAEFGRAGSRSDALYNLAFIFAAQGSDDRAKQCFRQALSIDPSHEKAANALASFNEFELAGDTLGPPLDKRDGVRYVPFIEKSDDSMGSESAVLPASHTADSADSAAKSRATSNAIRSLNKRSEALLNRSTGSESEW